MNSKGFAPILMLLIVAAVIAVGGAWLYTSKISSTPQPQQSTQPISTTPAVGASAPASLSLSPTTVKTKKASVTPVPTKIIPSSPASTSAPSAATIVTPTPALATKLINGKTIAQRLQEASDRLHTSGSGQQIRTDFPDIQLMYTDAADGTGFPSMILPFKYYYSQEADKTFSICNIDSTVFICTGKLDHLITKEDITSKRCAATPVYLNDPRLGGSGQYY